MHQSWLKNHMCVLRWISRSHARNGNEIQTFGLRGSTGEIEKLRFLIPVNLKHAWKSWNLAWCHDMAPTCCCNFFGQIGTSFGTSFLQTRASLKKARGSERERVTPVCETTYIHCRHPPYFLHSQIRPNRSTVLNFGIIPGSFRLFYTLIEFLGI